MYPFSIHVGPTISVFEMNSFYTLYRLSEQSLKNKQTNILCIFNHILKYRISPLTFIVPLVGKSRCDQGHILEGLWVPCWGAKKEGKGKGRKEKRGDKKEKRWGSHSRANRSSREKNFKCTKLVGVPELISHWPPARVCDLATSWICPYYDGLDTTFPFSWSNPNLFL